MTMDTLGDVMLAGILAVRFFLGSGVLFGIVAALASSLSEKRKG
jgi:hypothetical protein